MFKCALSGICLIFFLTSCALEPPQLPRRINEAYDFEVTHCDSFALVTGVSRHANNLAEAKQSAALQGEELGGTHIVWLQTDMGEPTKVVAIVYKCLL